MKKIFKRLGFTLAEILIVIGIIGGVAIMVLPTLKDNYEEHVFEARAKATYNILQQAVALSKYSGDKYVGGKPDIFFDKYIKESIKLTSVCQGNQCVGKVYENGPAPTDLVGSTQDEHPEGILYGMSIKHSFSLNNGAQVYIGRVVDLGYNFGMQLIDNYPKNKQVLLIVFDTNGSSEPNRFGLDIFITYWNGRELIPLGTNRSPKDVNKNCSMDGTEDMINTGYWNGSFCLRYMIDNGWKIKQEIKDSLL